MKRILFVDDERHVLEGLQRMFRSQRKHWEMSFAESGEEALTVLGTAPFDVIVTDMRMPGMDGAKLLEIVQERFPSVARIILSGHVELEAALRAAAVAHQFRSKPCDPDTLRGAIERACECRTTLGDESIRNVVGAVGRLPSLPATCVSLLHALQDQDVNLGQITRIIEEDVGIAAKVLQLVNSAFFGFHNEVTSVAAALNFLGLDTLKQLVLSVEILRTFQPSPLCLFSLNEFERDSRLAARIAAILPIPARTTASAATVAALLHDTGKLILASRLPEQFDRSLRGAQEKRTPLHFAEQEVIGTDHAQVGAYLLDLWGLPKPIVEAVRWHHQPGSAETPGRNLDVLGATHIACALAHELTANDQQSGDASLSLLDWDYLAVLQVGERIPTWRGDAQRILAEGV